LSIAGEEEEEEEETNCKLIAAFKRKDLYEA